MAFVAAVDIFSGPPQLPMPLRIEASDLLLRRHSDAVEPRWRKRF